MAKFTYRLTQIKRAVHALINVPSSYTDLLEKLAQQCKDLDEIAVRFRVWSDLLDSQSLFITQHTPETTDCNVGIESSRIMKYEKKTWLPLKEVRFPLWMDDDGNYQESKYLKALAFVKERRTAIDVGANVGFFSRYMCRDFETVHAFEPNQITRACLGRNVLSNNCIISPFAVSDHTGGERQIYYTDVATGGASIQPSAEELEVWKQQYELKQDAVRLIALDDLNLKNVDFIKIDVQGHEDSVIRGARRLLTEQSPVLLVEVEANKSRNYEVINLLENLGYSIVKPLGKDVVLKKAD